MNKERIIIWGTGGVAWQTFHDCQTINQYEILAFVDNDKEKWGTQYRGIEIHSPEFVFQNKSEYSKIVILTNSFEEIRNQIITESPDLDACIENSNYFYKISIFKRYQETDDLEIIKILDYLKIHPLKVFNYSFTEKYDKLNPQIMKDEDNGLFYALHNGKKMYFSRNYSNEESVRNYYRFISMEQDIESPHRYLTDDFDVEDGDVVLDVGVAEGNFSLDIIERVKKLYLIEADPLWEEALEHTFKPYRDKVEIIRKYATSYNEGDFAKIDTIIKDSLDFIKMDIEGNEWDALLGARETIAKSKRIKIIACCYHSDFDRVLLENLFNKNGIQYTFSNGYMWFPETIRQSTVSTRLNRGLIKGIKS